MSKVASPQQVGVYVKAEDRHRVRDAISLFRERMNAVCSRYTGCSKPTLVFRTQGPTQETK